MMRAKNYSLTCPACKVAYPTVGAYMNHARYTSCTDEDRFWARVNKAAPNGCWEWTGYRQKFGHGYLGRGGKKGYQTYHLAHRYAWKQLGHPLRDDEMLLHSCDNPPCVNPAHLFIGDDAANSADKWAKGRGASKLKPDDVRAIRNLLGTKPAKDIAAQFNVSQSAISEIKLGHKWRNVT